jgi:hypothetical protein
MNEGIRRLGKIDTVDIYFDQYIEKNNFIFGWKGNTPQESGMIFVPYESMKDCEGVPLPDVNDPKEQGVLIKRTDVDFMIGSSEDFEDYKKALALYMKQQEINCFDNNIFNFIQKGI